MIQRLSLCRCQWESGQSQFAALKLRTDYTDGDPDLEKNFYILLHTAAPAVLSESLFMDNQADCDFL